MSSLIQEKPAGFALAVSKPQAGDDLLSFIRSRLNVIGASLYLLEHALDRSNLSQQKHAEKINQELEIIRRMINR